MDGTFNCLPAIQRYIDRMEHRYGFSGLEGLDASAGSQWGY